MRTILSGRGQRLRIAGAALFAAATLLGACGGDDEPGSDEDYVRAACSALKTFNERRQELVANVNPANPDEVAGEFSDALNDLADSMDDANPPADARDAHDEVVRALQDAADAIEDGGFAALTEVQLPSVQIEPGVRNRLQAIFNSTPECEGSESIFS